MQGSPTLREKKKKKKKSVSTYCATCMILIWCTGISHIKREEEEEEEEREYLLCYLYDSHLVYWDLPH